MLTKERQYRIIAMINEKSFVTVKELMAYFGVSRSSIMRDLIELENQNLIKRERGGASAVDIDMPTVTSFNEKSVESKEALNKEEKIAVCREAAKHISDGDCIFIDSGTTPVYLLDYISDKNIKIVTPSTYLVSKISEDFKGEVYLLGGEFRKKYDMSYGPLTLEMIKFFNFTHAFFSANGVNIKNGEVYIFDMNIGAIKRAVMERTKENYLLVDSSKLEIKALYTWAYSDEFNNVYVNEPNYNCEFPQNYCICRV